MILIAKAVHPGEIAICYTLQQSECIDTKTQCKEQKDKFEGEKGKHR
jgi:hypothetical protein